MAATAGPLDVGPTSSAMNKNATSPVAGERCSQSSSTGTMTVVVHVRCERCQQETMSEITSSSELTCDSGNSVLSLLQGAGLLQNLTQIAEKARNEDERVLTDKLELVKKTNSQLESGEKELAEKKNRITSLMTELEELKKQVQTTLDEKERLLLKRKHLNEECSHLQKKLHCCDSLLKVVPR